MVTKNFKISIRSSNLSIPEKRACLRSVFDILLSTGNKKKSKNVNSKKHGEENKKTIRK